MDIDTLLNGEWVYAETPEDLDEYVATLSWDKKELFWSGPGKYYVVVYTYTYSCGCCHDRVVKSFCDDTLKIEIEEIKQKLRYQLERTLKELDNILGGTEGEPLGE